MEHAFTNDLINETSPYLLQHAHNPVNWYPWGEVALQKAKETDRPILVSIGYAACHWCHVMERESFENEEVASYMNEHFINIKIDREERPDLDHIYMDAVQAIAGSGGWPLNVFLTTEAKPFYGGTYFPPKKAFNRPSWKDVLSFITEVWKQKRDEIEQQAETLLDHISSSNHLVSKTRLAEEILNKDGFTEEECRIISNNILQSADTIQGGFGNAPKFPQTFTLQYLLAFGYHFKDEKSLNHASFSLQKMLEGGIYDHLAGGLARYSTDAQWLAPHFEKMLYDNALLVSVLCDAYQVTRNIFFKEYIEKTLHFFINEMQDPVSGFYAALDADSEGEEGKFYVWEMAEIKDVLGKDSKIFCEWYGVTERGNWEGKNILHVRNSKKEFADQNNITVDQLDSILLSSEKQLLAKRNTRIKPATDDKILLGWNALLLTAFCKAAAALGNDDYKKIAIRLHDFLFNKFSKDGRIIFHSYKNGEARHPAYLDDHAALIQASILLQEITGNQEYLLHAKSMTDYVIEQFLDKESGFFYFTRHGQTDVITRKIEIHDGATASGNSTMAENLFYLSIVFDKPEWWSIANKMLIKLSEIILKYPTSFGVWAGLILKQVCGFREIAITGKKSAVLLKDILDIYLPARILQSSDEERDLPLLKNKIYGENPLIYVCKNYSCSAPVTGVNELKLLLKNDH